MTTKGDVAKVTAPIYGSVPKADPTPAPFPDLVAALAWFDDKPELEPTLISLTALGTEGQMVEVNALMPKRLIYAERYTFDAQGHMTHKLGLSDDGLGKQVFASSYPLHFGSFGGLPVKIAYGLLGVGPVRGDQQRRDHLADPSPRSRTSAPAPGEGLGGRSSGARPRPWPCRPPCGWR